MNITFKTVLKILILIIATGEILDGSPPNNALKLVREWLGLHRDELQHMWETQEFKKITPLEK